MKEKVRNNREMDKVGRERRDVGKTGGDAGRKERKEEEGRQAGWKEEGGDEEVKRKTAQISQWEGKASEEQGGNCQARLASFPAVSWISLGLHHQLAWVQRLQPRPLVSVQGLLRAYLLSPGS